MQALTLSADWAPCPDAALSDSEIKTRRVRSGSHVWRNPRIALGASPDPTPNLGEVIIQVAAVGVCGSDMHGRI